jgi:hypothetical protein
VAGEIPEICADALQKKSGGSMTAMMKLSSKFMEGLAGDDILNP